MPKSKQNQKRRKKLKNKQVDTTKWVRRKVDAFNALPQEDKQAMMKRWSFDKKKQEPEEAEDVE